MRWGISMPIFPRGGVNGYLEVVKQVYQRFAEGDLEGFLKLCSEDIEWVVNGP